MTDEEQKNDKENRSSVFINLVIGCFVIAGFIIWMFTNTLTSNDENTFEDNSYVTVEDQVEEKSSTDPIEFAKQLQAKIEKKYPGGVNGVRTYEQYQAAKQDILDAYSKKKCLLKLDNVCFKPAFLITKVDGMLYQDCLSYGGEYGIKYCYDRSDAYAGLVQKCGGTQNLPTKKEIMMLADYLYGVKTEDCANPDIGDFHECRDKYREGYPIKRDNDLVQEYFLYIHPFLPQSGEDYRNQQNNEAFNIASGEERSGKFVYGWNFTRNGVSYNSDLYRSYFYDNLGMCVSRD